ncbi:MAG: radical SAM family heme chaperone HemW, partial [Actinomycetota bacterium]|nr:radical SAM family heme chaperone HemW [Actinomycetota bacterium]
MSAPLDAGGIYVHVPFCLTRCGYCDFNAYAGLDHLASRYVSALLREAELVAPAWEGVEFVSVFLGGGTPTKLEVADLKALLMRLRSSYAVKSDPEVTIEANPDTVDPTRLSALLEAGFGRLSMGAQSFDRAVLAALERIHQPESVVRAFRDARSAGYDNVNLDLIYGAAGEGLESWERTLEEAIGLSPEHVSAYALTIEPATAFGAAVASGRMPAPDDDDQATKYALAEDVLGRAGLANYEISNWAKPGHECRHN